MPLACRHCSVMRRAMLTVLAALVASSQAFQSPKPQLRHLRPLQQQQQRAPRSAPALPASRLAEALSPRFSALDGRIAAVAVPAIFSLVVFPLVGMVDTFFVGRMGDAISLAGMGAANAAYSAVFFVLAVVPTLTAPKVARAKGRGDDEGLRRAVRDSLWVSGVTGLLGTICLCGFPVQFLEAIVLPQGAPAVQPAADYLRLRALGFLPALLSSTCCAAYRGLLDTRTPLRISLAYNALNAVLDPLLIFPAGLGVAGAALATAASELAGCLVYLELLSRRVGGPRLAKSFWRRAPTKGARGARDGRRGHAGAAAGAQRRVRVRGARDAAMDATGVQAAAYAISQQFWLLCGVALFALQSSAAALVPAALGDGRRGRRGAARGPPVNGVAFVAEGVLLGLGRFGFLAAQTALGACAMLVGLRVADAKHAGLAGVVAAIFAFNLVQAVAALLHHLRLGPLAGRAADCAPAVGGGRAEQVCVVDDDDASATT
ncbi:hypothetical protein JL720_241 [Aureococcus anophagefferens]|nr:hypothetical protein JL720_241 [Aureococcus anophagefferens]